MVSEGMAKVFATFGYVVTYKQPFRWAVRRFGGLAETIRQKVSRWAGSVASRAAPRSIDDDEFAGTIHQPPDEVEDLLEDEGFIRNLLSRLKTRNGEPEIGSWVYREDPRVEYQLHVMIFSGDDDSVDVYAHHEYSSVNPDVAYQHFTGDKLDPEGGVVRVREKLPIDASDG
ncbi:hypothetical protein [Halorhabdus rudnickae]|uniref:hypothetical protein n=1 Tax=Halorhabdus rudnickae TaxID=1775544 RepID=UPI001083B4CF|nr:hypothetical protein [Halorhabdus rudnickae]